MEENKTPEKVKIPEIIIKEDKVVVPTKEIPLIINGKEVMITLQKLQAGKRRDLSKTYLQTKIVGQQIQGNMDAAGYQLGLLCKIIIKAPFEISEKMIASFPEEVTDYIYNEYKLWTSDSKKKVD